VEASNQAKQSDGIGVAVNVVLEYSIIKGHCGNIFRRVTNRDYPNATALTKDVVD